MCRYVAVDTVCLITEVSRGGGEELHVELSSAIVFLIPSTCIMGMGIENNTLKMYMVRDTGVIDCD